MALVQAAALGLILLILTPGALFYFDVTPKLVVLFAGVAICLPGVRCPRFSVFTLLLLLTAGSLALSTALSVNPALSVFGTNWRRFGAVPQVAVLAFAWLVYCETAARPDAARVVLRGIVLAGGLAAIYGIAQYFGRDPFLPAAAYHTGEGIWTIVRPPGTLGHAAYYATALLFAAFLAPAQASLEKSAWWKRIAWSASALAAAAMVLTGTRAALLGFAAGLALWLAMRGFRVPRRMVRASALVLLAGVAFYFSPPGWNLRSRARWFREDAWGGARPLLWRDSLRMALHRPLTGFGPEVFTGEFPAYESAQLARRLPDFAHESPHNMFLDAFVAQGIPGLLLLAAVCSVGLAAARRFPHPGLAAALAAGMVSQQFTAFSMPTALLVYTAVALAAGWAGRAPGPDRFSSPRALALAPLSLLLFYGALRLAAADHDLEQTRRAIDAGDLRAAQLLYETYDRRRLPGATADLWYSRALLRAGAIGPAGIAGLRATTSAEDPFNAWYHLAGIYAIRGDAAGTERCLRAAIAAHPRWFKPHWALARLLRLQGRAAAAESESRLALYLNAGRDPEVAQSLSQPSP